MTYLKDPEYYNYDIIIPLLYQWSIEDGFTMRKEIYHMGMVHCSDRINEEIERRAVGDTYLE